MAAAWYEERGYRVLARNWHCRSGELDLVVARPARHEPVVVVEVKARRGAGFGTPEEAVTPAKQRRVRRAAAAWLADARDADTLAGWRAVRFDVVAVEPRGRRQPQVTVVPGAF